MKNIVLIGMPGSGKSTVGVLLAKSLGFPFLDSDLLIQENEKRLLQNIIDADGLDIFLNTEEKVINSISCTGTVIATGGSAVCRSSSMEHLKKDGVVIYLKLSAKKLQKRIKNINTRGIAAKKGESINDILAYRSPLYEKYCDFTIDCNKMNIEAVVEAIIQAVKLYQKK